MTDIKIKTLILENFKCHRLLKLDFNGVNAKILGDNASGKTTIYDAFTWMLFAKDSAGNGEKNMEIKPLDASGNVEDHQAITAVEAVLVVDGEELALKRTYRELWTTKRGAIEATYDGNTSEYYIDGVPVQKKGFAEKVSQLVDEDTFRALTDVKYFASTLPWQDRRRILFDMAGVMDDRQILATDARFEPLLQSMGKLSLDDFKKKLMAEKKTLVGAKTDIPARISECQKTVDDIVGLDFTRAKEAAQKLSAQLDSLNEQLMAVEKGNTADEKALEIRRVKIDIEALEKENQLFRDMQTKGSTDVYALNSRLTMLNMAIDSKKRQLQREEVYIKEQDDNIHAYRARWIDLNGEIFAESNCPTCGQQLPPERLQASIEQFEQSKKKRLAQIEEMAASFKAAKAQAEYRLAEIGGEIAKAEAEQKQLQQQIADANAKQVTPNDMADYAQRKQVLTDTLESLNDDLQKIIESVSAKKVELQKEISNVKQRLREEQSVVNKESLLIYSRERIETLRQDAQNAAQCLATIEQQLFLIETYLRYKTQFVEESVNSLFRLTKFRLFREQANGGVEERCDAQFDGVPYSSLNNGMKINLGVDIINTLSRHYGVSVPLFIDNAESVTRLEQSDAQVIQLVVSEKDKELNVKYENT